MIDRTITAIEERARYVPVDDIVTPLKRVGFGERVVQPSGQASFLSTQKPASSVTSLALPQLKAPRVDVARDAEQVKSVAEIIRSTGIGDADISAALKRIGGNVARWEASLSQKIQAHGNAVSSFSVSVEHVQAAVDACERGAATPSKLDAAAAALAEAVRKEASCTAATKALQTTPESLGIDVTQLLSGTAILTIALAKLQKLMSDSNIDALDGQRKMLNELSAARQTTLQKAADDYAAKLAEAKHLQDTVGEIAKIGGWALTIIGVGLAVFTGGASLLIAAAGLALMAADAVCKAVTGTSFIDEAMRPVMDHAIKPLMEWLSKKIASVLEDFGVSKEKAEIAGAVVAGVAVAAVMVTGVVAIGSVGGKIASVLVESTAKELAEVMESAVVRGVKDVMVKLADDTGMTTMASRAKTLFAEMRAQIGFDSLEEGQIYAIATRGKAGLAVGETALSGTQAAVNTIAAADTRDASVMQAAVTRALADKKVIAQLLQELAMTFSNSLSAMTSLGNAMSDALKSETATDTFVLNNARAV